ncbi:MAG: glutamate racemase [Abditibacteriota bacterium]|nr:glutamate racemase [Abditibacteriota bacterium]MBP5092636.1 glutamate racemase [Abditibacteriota bacterium]
MNNSPIGVFDSGMGGLSVASEILKVLPEESVAYFADFAHVPYGERPYSEIRSFALAISEFLVSRGAKAIVMACNVSSAVAMDTVRERFPRIPVIGMIKSGAKAAVAAAAGKPVGVLATTGTIKSKAYDAEIAKLAPEIPVFGVGCPRFVPLVEAGKTHSPEAMEAAREYAEPLTKADCGTIVLGCTHYPFLADAVRAAAPKAKLINPAEEAASYLKQTLERLDLLSAEKTGDKFYASGENKNFLTLGSEFLGEEIHAVKYVTL